ncbi:MAG: hypothetical protein E7033_01445 [Akkermansiaceae bacterium]|nr:hypothetical protein [Akkermansiaceae bacterium]
MSTQDSSHSTPKTTSRNKKANSWMIMGLLRLFALVFYAVKWIFLSIWTILIVWPHDITVKRGEDSKGIFFFLLYLVALLVFLYFALYRNEFGWL